MLDMILRWGLLIRLIAELIGWLRRPRDRSRPAPPPAEA